MKSEKNYTILDYLDPTRELIENDRINISPYVAAFQHARFASNRDEKTGNKLPGKKHSSWLGAIGYMIVLDIIGSKFSILESRNRIGEIEKKYNKDQKVPSIIMALGYFSNLPCEEIFALYALRCAFIHDFFLYNNESKKYVHHFQVTDGKGKVVTLPNIKWDGDLKNRNINITIVNLEALGDLVEEIHRKLLTFTRKNLLKINLGANLDYLTYFKE